MADLIRGANAPLNATTLTVAVSGARQGTVDLMVFQLAGDRRVRTDADFIFFNQPVSPEGAVRLAGGDRLSVNLGDIPVDIETLAVAVALDDSVSGSLSSITGLAAAVTGGNESHTAPAAGLTTERAAVLIELYRRGPAWKVRNVSAGWREGLAALAREHGVDVADSGSDSTTPSSPDVSQPPAPPAPAPVTSPPAPMVGPGPGPGAPGSVTPTGPQPTPAWQLPPPFQAPLSDSPAPFRWPSPGTGPTSSAGRDAPSTWSTSAAGPASTPGASAWSASAAPRSSVATESGPRSVPGEEKLSLVKRQTLDLRKREVHKVLLTKGATQERARIVLVLDKTGSMYDEYASGLVHRVVERMVPVATQLDDDGSLECYLYAVKFARLPDLRVEYLEQWMADFIHISGVHQGIDYKKIGGYNDEIPIMNEIISTLKASSQPTLVLFFTDGGFGKKREITKLMQQASSLPAFWQFVGIGNNDFGILAKLDEMSGRVVDNVGFFPVSDIDRIDDAELYRRLLSEFPDWLRAARGAGILR